MQSVPGPALRPTVPKVAARRHYLVTAADPLDRVRTRTWKMGLMLVVPTMTLDERTEGEGHHE